MKEPPAKKQRVDTPKAPTPAATVPKPQTQPAKQEEKGGAAEPTESVADLLKKWT